MKCSIIRYDRYEKKLELPNASTQSVVESDHTFYL
jgi:hypothetical protein